VDLANDAEEEEENEIAEFRFWIADCRLQIAD
jgi:hypothetical protein